MAGLEIAESIWHPVLSQAKEKDAEKQQNQMREEQDNFTEMANNVHGDMLTENPAVAQSAFGSHRVVPDRWKGMTPQQVKDVLDTQEKQRQEKEVSQTVDHCW